MPLTDEEAQSAGVLVAQIRAVGEQLYAIGRDEMPAEVVADLWEKYFEALTELQQLIPPMVDPLGGA